MAAALVQNRETLGDNSDGSPVTLAFSSNVTAGNKVTMEVARYSGDVADPLVVGDGTKSAGTATIGTIALDAEEENNTDTNNRVQVGIFRADVTGTGSMTWSIALPTGYFVWINISEWSGLATGVEDGANVGAGTGTAAASGSGTSAGAGLFLGAIATNAGVAVTLTADASWTATLNEEEAGDQHTTGQSAYRIVASGTTDDFDCTLGSSQEWCAVCAVYADAGGGGTALTIPVAAKNLANLFAQN